MNVDVVLTGVVTIGGVSYGHGARVHLPEDEARSLVAQGKARIVSRPVETPAPAAPAVETPKRKQKGKEKWPTS